MGKLKKWIPNLLVTLSVLALCVVALSFATTDENQKAEYEQQLNAIRSTSQAETIDPAVAAKLAMEAEIQAKLEAEEEGESHHEDPSYELGLPTASRPAVQEDLRVNPFKRQPIMTTHTPKGEILWEGFEGGTVPPPNWTAVVNNPYTWEIDDYNPYEGTYNASCYYDDSYTGTQDEWLISPAIDLSGESGWKLEFVWMGSYYWSVDPYDNCDLEVWISTDGGANFTTKLWCEEDVGEFTTFTWYEATVDLSAYSTESNVKLGFRYYGYDGAQFSIDAISVNNEAAPIGRCCYDDPAAPLCVDVTEAECEAMGGYSWDEGLNCEDNPCPTAPENDECTNAELIPPPFPATASGTTEGATIDCPGVLDWNAVWYKFDAPNECNDVVIDYCGSPYEILCVGVVLYASCDDCPNYILYNSIEWLDCEGLTQPKIYWNNLPGPATYYIPVFIGDADCLPIESPFQFTLDVLECPPPEPGDNCSEPFVVNIGGGDLPYTIANQYTCGRSDNYNETCLGSYDGGEDLIVELVVTDDLGFVNITLDPKGTTYSGMSIDDECPDADVTCMGTVSSSDGNPKVISNIDLPAGTYYIMVDTWPTPDCIPDLDIIIEAAAGPQEGDNCANPIEVDIPTLPWCDNGQTTCGRGNYYEDPNDEICMGYYTNGEDIFYEITVLSEVTVNFHLDPKGTSYAGMGLFTSCPPTLDNCVDFETSSSSSPKSMTCVNLEPGVYYLMIDTWSTPYCIPEFDLCIVDTTCEALENDDCANATEINEVVDLAFSTDPATFDGGGTCLSSPNIWYCYTATETGNATISLCGSDYDTKMAVYDGCTCEPLGTELACNDDACGVQSEVEIPVTAGNSYLVEVGGYSSNTGTGILNISVSEPCVYECPEGSTPEGEVCLTDESIDDTNGGCNSEPPVFGSLSCGETVCGEFSTYLFGGSNYRDTDWYLLLLDGWYEVTLDAEGGFPIVFGFAEQYVLGVPGCDNITGYLNPYAAVDECTPASVVATLPPGTYIVFVSGQDYSGYTCAAGPWKYGITATCVPTAAVYCEASGGCDEYIERVEVGTIDNSSDCEGYGDFTALSTEMTPGVGYPITITINGGYSSDTGAVWVDWNQDVDFDDPGELQPLDVGHGSGPTYTGTITPPGDALAGQTRMRIRLTWNTEPTPCGAHSYGEVEDYTINVGGETITIDLDPDPVHVADGFTVVPNPGDIYLSNDFYPGYSVSDINLTTVMVNGTITPTGTAIIPAYPEMIGPVLDVTFLMRDFVLYYGFLFDTTLQTYTVSGEFNDGTPFSKDGQCTYVGHRSGDLNVDGDVNVADVTFFVEYLFTGGPAPFNLALGDVDASGDNPNVADLTYLIKYLFTGGSVPQHQ